MSARGSHSGGFKNASGLPASWRGLTMTSALVPARLHEFNRLAAERCPVLFHNSLRGTGTLNTYEAGVLGGFFYELRPLAAEGVELRKVPEPWIERDHLPSQYLSPG